MSHELLPIQLGVSVKGGAEAAVHAVRTFITNYIDSSDHKIIVKLDMMNAFNSVRRDHVMQTCMNRTPEIAKLSFLAYSKPSSVIASGHSITSSTGVQQGDPIGPLLFAFAVDQIASGIESELPVWYLDDATIGGSPESVLSDVQRCVTGLRRIGLIVNPKKTDIINVGLAAGRFSRVVNNFNELLPEIKVTELTKMELLGSPIVADATRCCILKKLHKGMNDRILLLDGHPGFFLLKNAFSFQRLLLTLRSEPCHHHPELLAEYDIITRSTTEALRNIRLDDNSWSQAKLPVRYGGLALRTAADLALPAFLSSRAASISLVNDILRQPTNKQEDDDEVWAWLDRNLVLPSNTHKQRNWDDIQCSSAVATLVTVLNQHRLACFKAASRPESGVWLNCVQNNSVGTFIDNDTLRIGVALRVGLTVCIPHRCKCGTTVDAFGTHPLSCRFSAGHIPRHSALSDVVRRGLSAAGILSMLEPSGLDRGVGKRPDGITVYLYSRDRCLIWDATCVNTFASSNLIRASVEHHLEQPTGCMDNVPEPSRGVPC